MEYTAHTINIKVYTPAGFSAFITLPFGGGDDNGYPTASDVDTLVEKLGFMAMPAGLEVGEEEETMTHVMRRTKYNDDGTETPIIAFYHSSPALAFKRDSMYLNTQDEINTFEALSGLKIAAIPNYEGSDWLERKANHPQSKKFIVQLPKPIRCAIGDGTWKNPKTGESGTTKKIKRFLDAPETVTPGNVIKMPSGERFTPETAKEFSDYWQTQGISANDVLGFLGISRLSEWQKTIDDANNLLSQRTS